MRVLHVNAGNLYGGIETLLVTLARQRALCAEMEPEFALCFEGRLAEELRAAEVPVHGLGIVRLSRPWTLVQARRRLRALIDTQRVDLVVTHGCWPHTLAAPVARRTCRPLVFWAHDRPVGRHWLQWWAGRSSPDLVLANSQATQDVLQSNLFPGCPSEVVYYPVARPTVRSDAATRSAVRAALATPDDAVVIVTACRADPYKGHRLLLEALARLPHPEPWRCWIAGGAQRPHEERLLAALQARVAALGLADKVQFLGQRTDVPVLLAAADIHCQPNAGPEPFGIAFVEALYAGLPVVTTAFGGALEIVDDSCGMLVPPGDTGRLTDALRRLIEDPRQRRQLGAGGPARAARLCDPATQLPEIGRILMSIAPRTAHAVAS